MRPWTSPSSAASTSVTPPPPVARTRSGPGDRGGGACSRRGARRAADPLARRARQRRRSPGTTKKVSTVEKSMPPTTAMPSGARDSPPAPLPSAIGRMPTMVASAVIRIGRKRVRDASKRRLDAARSPRSRSWFANSTIRIEFLVTRPDQHHEADLAEEVQRVCRSASSATQRAGERERHRDQDRERVDEALELRRRAPGRRRRPRAGRRRASALPDSKNFSDSPEKRSGSPARPAAPPRAIARRLLERLALGAPVAEVRRDRRRAQAVEVRERRAAPPSRAPSTTERERDELRRRCRARRAREVARVVRARRGSSCAITS